VCDTLVQHRQSHPLNLEARNEWYCLLFRNFRNSFTRTHANTEFDAAPENSVHGRHHPPALAANRTVWFG